MKIKSSGRFVQKLLAKFGTENSSPGNFGHLEAIHRIIAQHLKTPYRLAKKNSKFFLGSSAQNEPCKRELKFPEG